MDDPKAPTISIIIPCRNEAAHIEECLGSILAQEPLPDGRTFEVVVADGLSDDGTREKLQALAARDPRVRMIDNPGRIVPCGLNAAIQAARGDIIIRMDAHADYAPDFIRQCVSVLEETGADNVGGATVARGKGYISRAVAAAFQSPFAVGGARWHNPDWEGPVDTTFPGCWHKAIFSRIGLFDEALVRNQDDEFNLRTTLAGGTIWHSPRIRSWYSPRSSLRSLFRQYLQYGYFKVRVIQKHGRPASWRHLVPVLFVLGVAFGWLVGFVHWTFRLVYVAALALYAALSLVFSLRSAGAAGWDLLPIMPVVFFIYHAAYGLGFAGGLLDFVILRRGPRSAMTAMTRPSTAPTGDRDRGSGVGDKRNVDDPSNTG
jgi:glycosyltransferase involved in cell wall biosynthesis